MKILGALKGILEKHLKDKQFQGLLKKENRLARELTTAVQKRIKEFDSQNVLRFVPVIDDRGKLTLNVPQYRSESEQWLIDVLLKGSQDVGKLFVITVLPREIVEQVLNSRVPEAHYSKVGADLLKIAEKRQKDSGLFRLHLEQARKEPPAPPTPKTKKLSQ